MHTKITRKSLTLENRKLQALQKMLGAPSKSEAVREAIDRILAGDEIIAAFERLRRHGAWTNQYKRTTR